MEPEACQHAAVRNAVRPLYILIVPRRAGATAPGGAASWFRR